jgi:hypothetical protein
MQNSDSIDRHHIGDRAVLAEGDVRLHRAIFEFVLEELAGRELIAIELIDGIDVFIKVSVFAIGFGSDLLDRELDPSRINLTSRKPSGPASMAL